MLIPTCLHQEIHLAVLFLRTTQERALLAGSVISVSYQGPQGDEMGKVQPPGNSLEREGESGGEGGWVGVKVGGSGLTPVGDAISDDGTGERLALLAQTAGAGGSHGSGVGSNLVECRSQTQGGAGGVGDGRLCEVGSLPHAQPRGSQGVEVPTGQVQVQAPDPRGGCATAGLPAEGNVPGAHHLQQPGGMPGRTPTVGDAMCTPGSDAC